MSGRLRKVPSFVLNQMDCLDYLRRKRGLSRRKLSELTGVKVSLIIRYEYCGYIPTKENYNRLAEYFGWPLWE